jgi:hypothetical protein
MKQGHFNKKKNPNFRVFFCIKQSRGCMHRRVFIKKTWLSAFSYAQSRISLVFCRSLGFLVPWSSSLTAVSDLADILYQVWRRM